MEASFLLFLDNLFKFMENIFDNILNKRLISYKIVKYHVCTDLIIKVKEFYVFHFLILSIIIIKKCPKM